METLELAMESKGSGGVLKITVDDALKLRELLGLNQANLRDSQLQELEQAKVEIAELGEEVSRLSSPEYIKEIFQGWLLAMPRESYIKLGEELGYIEPVPVAADPPMVETEEAAAMAEKKPVTLGGFVLSILEGRYNSRNKQE